MTTTSSALAELSTYCDLAVRHSYDQYEKHGTLLSKAVIAFRDPSVWEEEWVPRDFDATDAAAHPVWQAMTREQKLAWNHFEWALLYSSVAQGEKQIIVLNNFAVRDYARTLPAVVELERRESFEETDHIEAFRVVLEGIRQRYLKASPEPIWSQSASGFTNAQLNAIVRGAIGRVANYLLGSNFPTLFFLARGMKTHGFKPFENTIAGYDGGHAAIRMISHLHRLDESRHMATSLHLARLSSAVLDTLPNDNRWLFRQAVHAAFPKGRSTVFRLGYWRRVLDEATIYADIPKEERDALYAHMAARTDANLQSLHAVQTRLTRQANKRIVEECGLSPEMKRLFVEIMREDPAYAATVDAVKLEH